MIMSDKSIQKELQDLLSNYFEPSETVTAQHILYENFVKEHGRLITKFQCYLTWHEAWGNPELKDEAGNLGYKMKVLPKKDSYGQ